MDGGGGAGDLSLHLHFVSAVPPHSLSQISLPPFAPGPPEEKPEERQGLKTWREKNLFQARTSVPFTSKTYSSVGEYGCFLHSRSLPNTGCKYCAIILYATTVYTLGAMKTIICWSQFSPATLKDVLG